MNPGLDFWSFRHDLKIPNSPKSSSCGVVKILKKSDSTHSSSKGAVNAYFLTGSFSKKTWLFEAVVLVG